MTRRLLGRAIFLRHGQTEYTDIFPDLTWQGIKTIENSAELIRPIIEEHQRVAIVASPMVRAQGSASILASKLGYEGKIKEEPTIASALIETRNLMRAKAIFDEYVSNGGIRALSVAYGTDPRYEDGEVIEPRSKVRKRFFDYFAHLIRCLLIDPPPPCLIHVSHYETLYHFVEHLFQLDYKKDEPLGHGEIIVVSIFDIGIENIVEIEVAFRGKTIRKKIFDYVDKEIR